MREPLCFIIVYAGLGEASGEWRWSKVVLILALNLVWRGKKLKELIKLCEYNMDLGTTKAHVSHTPTPFYQLIYEPWKI